MFKVAKRCCGTASAWPPPTGTFCLTKAATQTVLLPLHHETYAESILPDADVEGDPPFQPPGKKPTLLVAPLYKGVSLCLDGRAVIHESYLPRSAYFLLLWFFKTML